MYDTWDWEHADREDVSDPDQVSDISEPEIINVGSSSNGDSSDSASRSGVLIAPLTDLPSTVTYLEGPSRSQVYIVGTAHFSEESNQDVVTTIEKVRPHIVCLELCKNRLHVIKCSEEEILEEVQNIGLTKMRELIARSGVFYGLFQLAFLHLSAGLTKQLGMAPGGEFRAAYRKGRELGCTFRLSDRSIQVTLQRAIYSLSVWKQLGLAVRLIFNNEKVTKEDVESFKGDVLQKLIENIAGEYPNLSRIFVDERDQYLSNKIFLAAGEGVGSLCKHSPSNNGSDDSEDCAAPVEETTKVVAVVGIGHIAGIKKYWGTVVDCEAMCKIPEASLQSRIIGKTLKYTFLSLLLYGSCKVVSLGYHGLYPYLPAVSPYFVSLLQSLQSYLKFQ